MQLDQHQGWHVVVAVQNRTAIVHSGREVGGTSNIISE